MMVFHIMYAHRATNDAHNTSIFVQGSSTAEVPEDVRITEQYQQSEGEEVGDEGGGDQDQDDGREGKDNSGDDRMETEEEDNITGTEQEVKKVRLGAQQLCVSSI